MWHHRLGHPSLPRLRGMHSRLLVSGLPRSLPPLPPSPAPPCLPCVEGRQRAAPHSSSFPPTTAPLQTLHMDVWGPARVSGQSRERYFLLVVDDYTRYTTVSPLRSKGQVVDVLIPWIRTICLQLRERFGQDLRRRIGLVMEVARTSMIHAAAPHFLWPFADRYAAHQLNIWPRVSLPDTSPTLRWTREVGDASVFRIWGFRAFFYHPTSHRIFPSQDITFDESVPFYRLFPYRSAPPPPPPLFLALGPPLVDPLPPQGPAPSGVSQVDPLPGRAPVHVAVNSGAARGAVFGGVEPGGAECEGAETGGTEPGGVETGGAEPGGVPGGAASEGAESGGEEARGAALSGGSAGASPRLSPQQLRPGVAAGNGVTGGTATTGPGGARTQGTGVAGTGGVEGAGAGAPTDPGVAAGARGTGTGGAGAGGTRAAGVGAVDPGAAGPGDTVRPRPNFVPLLQQTGGLTERREPVSRPVSPVRTARRVPRSRPPSVPGTHAMTLRRSSVPLRVPLPAPPKSSLPEVRDPESDHARAFSPTISRLLATAVTDPSFASAAAFALVAELLDFVAACRLDYASALVAESASACSPSVRGECALGTDALEDTVKRPPGSPSAFKARYVSRGFSQQQGVDYFQTFSPTLKMTTLRVLLHVAAQHDYELHSLDFSTAFLQGSLHEEIWLRPLPGFTESFPAGTQWSLRRPVYGLRQAPRAWHDTLRTRLAALGLALATADPSLFLCTNTSLPPFYVLIYVDDLVFATADTEALTLVKSELQKRHTCTDLGELRSYLGLQITQDRARRTISLTQSHMVHQVLQRFGFQFSSPQPTHLSTSHSLSAPPSNESVEQNGPYPELVGCLMYLMTCTRPDLAYPLSVLARYVAPGRHRKLSSPVTQTPPGLTTQLRSYTFSLGSGSVSWQSTRSSSVLSSSCEAEIYAGAMVAQELRWLTYLLTDFGEQPRSPPLLYVYNKAMIALCQEHGLEHRTKHIALRYFFARELQQRGQLRLAYVATRANTSACLLCFV
ncbi:unnamed protein product [Closterium sp. NIES-53]